MSNDKMPARPTGKVSVQKPKPVNQQAVKKGFQPNPQGGHQPTSHGAPAKPPSNPPNKGSGGKK